MRATTQAPRARVVTCAAMHEQSGRSQALGIAAAALVIVLAPSAKADLTSDLLAKSTANAELHNKQRLATSYSNFARSRTVTDGTCKFPAVCPSALRAVTISLPILPSNRHHATLPHLTLFHTYSPSAQNVLGCDLGSYAGDVKYIADDAKLECEGKGEGKCASNISIPQKNK